MTEDAETKKLLDETFKDSKGTPEVENKKRLAKQAASERKLNTNLRRTFYTIQNGKVLKLIAKPKGIHTVFIGREKTMKKETIRDMVTKWKKEGTYVEPYAYKDKLGEIVKQLFEKQQELRKEK